MQDYEVMLDAYAKAGGSPEALKDSRVAHLVVQSNRVIGAQRVEGLVLETRETPSGVEVLLVVRKGVRIERPVHLCFGVLPAEGVQEIGLRAEIEDGAHVQLLAHCVFPNAVKVVHRMKAQVSVGANAFYSYSEAHFHGEQGGIEVLPSAILRIGRNSRLATDFSLLHGRVGTLAIDYEAYVAEHGTVEMTAKVHGRGTDRIRIREAARLAGDFSRGLIKSRIAVQEEARSEVTSELTASGAQARGHVDCVEVVQGLAVASAIPIVKVTQESARVTHEAAIGRVDKKQVETLMARGLDEERAVAVVIGGMLK